MNFLDEPDGVRGLAKGRLRGASRQLFCGVSRVFWRRDRDGIDSKTTVLDAEFLSEQGFKAPFNVGGAPRRSRDANRSVGVVGASLNRRHFPSNSNNRLDGDSLPRICA
jgi:hypothetical protein